jgi:hypothetical protein
MKDTNGVLGGCDVYYSRVEVIKGSAFVNSRQRERLVRDSSGILQRDSSDRRRLEGVQSSNSESLLISHANPIRGNM